MDLPDGIKLGAPSDLCERLRPVAFQAQPQHYAPYSEFEVLAAVMSRDGEIYSGSNVENANYTLTIHAEQAAILAGLRDGVRERCGREWLKAIYVRCASEAAPCGGCRQALAEFASPGCLWIGEDTRSGVILSGALEALLPLSFGPAHLGR